jgi:CheY-like chemotaxis protein/DNA-directed RNA polymerase specialized sigma24 family protein
MSASEQLRAHLPYLRRYGRALTGSQNSGDAYVRATLEALLADRDLLAEAAENRAALFAAFNRIWSSGHVETEPAAVGADAGLHETAAAERLALVPPLHRQALLLTTLEEFSAADTARILGIGEAEVAPLVASAVAEIEGEAATDVLIIEDEPLIAMQLEDLVSGLGHTVTGTASTRTQAREIFAQKRPGLVLADIQLADGSSGIDAVEDILAFGDVPVIFVTAYPERLLTGERPEPTYLVTKPFLEETVRAAISQALFFGSSRPL